MITWYTTNGEIKLMTMERDLSSVRINFEAQNIYHLQWVKQMTMILLLI